MSPGIELTDGESRPVDPAIGSPRDLVAILNHVPGMVALWDRDLRNRFANRGYIEWFGLTPGQMHGMHLADVLGPEVFERNRPFIDGALAGEPQLFERTLVDTLGRTRVTQASYVPHVVDGRTRGFCVLVTDISARVTAEHALHESLADVAVLGERQRIAAELHQKVLAGLVDVSLDLASVVNSSPPAVGKRIREAIDGVDGTIADLRSSIFSLQRAVGADDLGSAIGRIVDDSATTLGFAPALTLSGELSRVPPAIASDLLAVLNEALSNVAKHAQAHGVEVHIAIDEHRIALVVADDGRGIGPAGRRSGLANMRARAQRRNGTFDCRPNVPSGTVVEWQVPTAAAEAATPPNPRWSAATHLDAPAVLDASAGPGASVESTDSLWTVADMVAVLDTIPAVVTLWDTELRNRFANAFAVSWFGRGSREEVWGRHISDLINPEVYEANLPYALAALSGEPQRFERTFVNGLGERHHTQVVYTPNAVGGVVHGMFVLVTDITARVEAQEQLRDSEERAAVLRDRERIAEDLHDVVIQRLFAACIGLQAAQSVSTSSNAARIEHAIDSMDDAILALRAAVKELRVPRHGADG